MLKTKPKTRLILTVFLALTSPIWFIPATLFAIFICICESIYEGLGE